MRSRRIDKRILRYDMCVGCGLCSSVFGKEQCEMHLSSDGFYRPLFKKEVDGDMLRNICPGISIHAKTSSGVWGTIQSVVEGWAADEVLRHKAASGGVCSALAIYLLESKKADAILHVGVREDSYLYNELVISRSKEDVFRHAQSRYAPALSLENIKQILDQTTEKYALIGKPCDIAGIKNLIQMYPQYEDRFVLFISIFCAGMPSYNATIETYKKSGRQESPKLLKYRGDGWPGFFHAVWADGYEYKLSYNESWGKILGRQLCFRCKVCPDGIGMLADVAVGDSWNTKDGYPDFTEAAGRNFVFVRTKRGQEAMACAKENNYLIYNRLDVEKIKSMQFYQYERRRFVGWKLLPVLVATRGLISFTGLDIIRQARKVNMLRGISNMKGSFVRLLKAMRRLEP